MSLSSQVILFVALVVLLVCLFVTAENPNPSEPCRIFIPETKVREVVSEHLTPYAKQHDDCVKAIDQIKKQIAEKEVKRKGINAEIELLKKLLEVVKQKVNERHDEKKLVIIAIEELLAKLTSPLNEVKKAIESLNEKVKKENAQCSTVESHRKKYVEALKTIDTAEDNMKYADTVILKYEHQRIEYTKKITEIKKLISSHETNIKTHEDKKSETENIQKSCQNTRQAHVEFTQKLKTCSANLTSVKNSFNSCSTSLTQLNSENKELEESIKNLNSQVQILKGEETKYKNIATLYMPKTPEEAEEEQANPNVPIDKYTGSYHICRSTGDPHYVALNADETPRKAAFDVYHQEGDFLLFRSPNGEFEVQTRLAYSKHWGTYSSNLAVAVKAAGNIIESYGGDNFRINGERNVIAVGQTKILSGGATVACSQRTASAQTYTITEPNGGIIIFSSFSLPEGQYYHDIALHSPVAWSKISTGLCVYPVRSVEKILKLRTDNKAGHHLFGTAYVADNSEHVVKDVHWINGKLKEDAEHYCFNVLQRRDDLYNDCLLDAKIAGTIEVLKGYSVQEKNIAKLMNIENQEHKLPIGRGYHILSRVLRALTNADRDILKSDVLKLLSSSGENEISAKVSTVISGLTKDIETIRSLNAELATRLAA